MNFGTRGSTRGGRGGRSGCCPSSAPPAAAGAAAGDSCFCPLPSVLSQTLLRLPGVSQVRSGIVLKELKASAPLPL